MGGHATWFDFIPGFESLKHSFEPMLARGWTWQIFQSTHFEVTHIAFALVVILLLVLGALRYRGAVLASADGGLVPPPSFNVRNLFEGIGEGVYGLLEGVLGDKEAKKQLPLLGTIFLFILLSNLISLIPGFRAPTDTLKTNLAMALAIFILTHVYGFRAHGAHYLKAFTGHVPLKWYFTPIILLMIGIELISHLIRPMTLSIRLAVNMVADHAVAIAFFTLVPFLVPVPFLVLGVFVCVVQATVFTLLSATYFSMAMAHEEEEHH